MRRYLLNCSRDLVELTRAEPPVIQFIHETVRDFLTRTSAPDANVSAGHDKPTILPNFSER